MIKKKSCIQIFRSKVIRFLRARTDRPEWIFITFSGPARRVKISKIDCEEPWIFLYARLCIAVSPGMKQYSTHMFLQAHIIVLKWKVLACSETRTLSHSHTTAHNYNRPLFRQKEDSQLRLSNGWVLDGKYLIKKKQVNSNSMHFGRLAHSQEYGIFSLGPFICRIFLFCSY